MQFFQKSVQELITQTSTNLPPDVRQAMAAAITSEQPSTKSSQALAVIATNIDMAADDVGPICQDTGMPTFESTLRWAPTSRDEENDSCGHRGSRSWASCGRTLWILNREEQRRQSWPWTPIMHFDQWKAIRKLK
jgi:fumarate hydratase class I